ncbi:MAG: hypothetical protein U9Q91_03840 [Candidatus Marinimicrobia bacterium]|nr:hypothetical protein [Candidatus Neomarinimicrobiota bacterium]
MKKLIKIWDVVLIAIMGILGTGCILDPPAPEYGVVPMYGVPAAVQEADEELQEQTQETEFPAQ